MLVQELPAWTEHGLERHNQPFPVGIDRRIGNLREALLEVAVEELRLLGEGGERGVISHRPYRNRAVKHHRFEDAIVVLSSVAEHLLHPPQGLQFPTSPRNRVGGQVARSDQVALHPGAVWPPPRVATLKLTVLENSALGCVDGEHHARPQPATFDHSLDRYRYETDLGTDDDEVVIGNPVALGTQAVAVERRDRVATVCQGQRGRTVPGFHQRSVVLIETLQVGIVLGVALERLRDQHHKGVYQIATGEMNELEGAI